MPSIVTANDLRSGLVVYLGPAARWVKSLEDAVVATDAGGLSLLETQAHDAVASSEVTAVYAMDVRLAGGVPEPVSVRERIRAAGAPTV